MDEMYNSGAAVSNVEINKPKIIDNLKEYNNNRDFLLYRHNG
jgi:hypothetical protein